MSPAEEAIRAEKFARAVSTCMNAKPVASVQRIDVVTYKEAVFGENVAARLSARRWEDLKRAATGLGLLCVRVTDDDSEERFYFVKRTNGDANKTDVIFARFVKIAGELENE